MRGLVEKMVMFSVAAVAAAAGWVYFAATRDEDGVPSMDSLANVIDGIVAVISAALGGE